MKLLQLTTIVAGCVLSQSFAQFKTTPIIGELPSFTENKGQIADQYGNIRKDVKFLYDNNGLKIHLKENSFSYEQYTIEPLETVSEATGLRERTGEYEYRSHRVDIGLIGANPKPDIIASEKSTDYQNFYLAHAPQGVLGVYSYKKIIYQNIYPNIDLVFSISRDKKQSSAKYEFIVKPKGNPADIRLVYHGAKNISLTNKNLRIQTAYGIIQEDAPVSFTKHQKPVTSEYILKNNTLSFKVGSYDKKDTLIIDPRIRNFGTYIGSTEGGNTTELEGFDSDASATFVYVGGNTVGTGTMATSGTFQTVHAGNGDAFVWKMNHTTGTRIWGTHIGGSNTEKIFDLACNTDVSPKIAIAGLTRSTNFPANTFQTTYGGGGEDGFLAVFNDDGTRSWSAYYGSSSEETLYGVAYDNNHYLVFTGRSGTSNQASLATAGTYQPTLKGVGTTDAIIGKFNPSGARLWATFYGGTQGESGISIAVDSNNDIIVAGRTNTPASTDIASTGAHQSIRAGGNDLFIAKLNSAGTTRAWGTYYGGTDEEGSNEFNYGVTVRTNKANGDIYVAATTKSFTNIASTGAHQTAYAGTTAPHTGFGDGFLVRFNANGVRQWGTYYGGSNAELLDGLSVASNGDVLISGMSISSAGISTPDAFRRELADSTLAVNTRQDGFFALFDINGNRKYATYYGGKGFDQFRIAHLFDDGTLYVGGNTFSRDCYQIATPDGFINDDVQFSKGFLVKFSPTGSKIGIACLQNICAGTTLKVPIFPEGTFGAGNQFIVEISDASGSFASPTVIGSLSATTADSVLVTVPSTTPDGTGYRMRVRSTQPALTSADNGNDIGIISPLFGFNSITPNNSSVCSETTLTVSYFTTCQLTIGSSVIAEISDITGNFASAIPIGQVQVTSGNRSGGSFSVKIPRVPSGTGYRIRLKATNPEIISAPFSTVYRITTPPKPNLGPDLTVCSSAVLDAGAGYTAYLWNTGATSQTITVSSSRDYSVRVTQSGCHAFDTVRVTIEKPQWEWAVRAGGNATASGEGGRALVGDKFGNAYTAGGVLTPISGNVSFQAVSGANTDLPTLYGGRDIYLTKYNQHGEVVWTQAAGTANSDLAGGLSLSPENKLYLVGFVGAGTVTFGRTDLGGTITQTSTGSNAFVAVYDTSGKILHVSIFTGGSSLANRVGFDKDGNYYVTGSFSGTTDFGNGKTLTASSSSIFVAKYNASNQCVWAAKLDGVGLQVNRIGVDALGNSYLRGWYQGDSLTPKNIGGFYLPVTRRNNTLTHFAAKYDSAGALKWVIRIIDGAPAGTETNEGGIITDSLGNTYFSGQFSGLGIISPTDSIVSAGGQDIFLMKITTDGSREWVRTVGSTGNDISYDIATDQYGDIYMTGRFQNAIQLGTSALTSNPGASDIFVAKFDGAGNVQWAQQSKSTGNPTPRPFSIATAPNISGETQVYVTGDFRSNTYRYELKDCNTTSLASSGLEDIFLAKLGQPFNQITVSSVSPTVFCTGSTVTVNFKAQGDYFTGNRFIVQISDSTGGFLNPTNIGSIVSTDTTGTVPIVLTMPGLPNGGGSGHRVRVIATDRPTIGTSSSVNLFVLNAFAGSDTTLCGTNSMTLQAARDRGVGTWSVISGTATFSDVNNPNALVANLSEGVNRLAWTKIQAGCSNVADTVQITVTNLEKATIKQMDNWTFGANAAVSFGSGKIQNHPSISGTTASSPGIHSTISDSLGNFLFSFDGNTVRDTIGVFFNGTTFNSDRKATLIAPHPTNPKAYWIFYNRNISGLQRAFVDVANRSVSLKDNRVTPLGVEVTEHLAGVGDGTGNVWIVIRRAGTQTFTAYKLQASTPTLNFTNTNIGATTPSGSSGVLRFSTNGKKAAMTVNSSAGSWVELYNFNPATGQFSNLITLEPTTHLRQFQGVEFSPDETKLYVTTSNGGEVFQYDLANGNIKTLINNTTVTSANSAYLDNMLLANDGKIYIAYSKGIGAFANSLAVIESPNSAGLAANYRDTAFNLGVPSHGDLVQFVVNHYKPTYVPFSFSYKDTCLGQNTQFEAVGTNLKSIRWDFGVASMSNDTSQLFTPTFTYPVAGTYTLSVKADLGCSEFTQTRQLSVNAIPTVNLGSDRDSCAFPIIIDAGNQPTGATILWNTGKTTRQDTITTVGKYWAVVSNGACLASDTVNVNFSSIYNSYHDRNWIFGDGNGAEFNSTGSYVFRYSVSNGGTSKVPSAFSMPDGRLKIWTDAESIGGFDVATQTHTRFTFSGDKLASNMGGSLIIPLADTNNYLVFYTSDNGLKVRTVNATTATVGAEINTTPGNTITKHLAGTYDGSNHFWIVTHQAHTNKFIALKYDKAGTLLTTTETSIGKILGSGNFFSQTYSDGVMKFSRDGRKIAFTGFSESGGFVQWFDFDLTTGILSNPQAYDFPGENNAFGVEFSPDNSKLYASTQFHAVESELYQLDIANNQVSVIGKIKDPNVRFASLQYAPDGKIYVAHEGMAFDTLGIIYNPNGNGASARFQDKQVAAIGGTSSGQLPQFVNNYSGNQFSQISITHSPLKCDGTPIEFSTSFKSPYYVWDFGDGNTDSTSQNTVFHLYSNSTLTPDADTFIVKLRVKTPCLADTTLIDTIKIFPTPIFDIADTTNCQVNTITLTIPVLGMTYGWYNATSGALLSTSIGRTFTASGKFVASARNASGCTWYDTFNVGLPATGVSNPSLTISGICQNEPIRFVASNPAGFAFTSWKFEFSSTPGDTLRTASDTTTKIYSTAGTYNVKLTGFNGCVERSFDTVLTIQNIYTPSVWLTTSQDTVCQNASIRLKADTSANTSFTYRWFINGALQSGALSPQFVKTNLSLDDTAFRLVATPQRVCSAVPFFDITQKIKVLPSATMSFSSPLSAFPNFVCEGDTVTLSFKPQNYITDPLKVEWSKRGVLRATTFVNSTEQFTFKDTIQENAGFKVNITSSYQCITTPTLTSDEVFVQVIKREMPTVSLNPNDSLICVATDAVFSPSNVVKAGISPQFKWYINGVAQSGFTPASTFTVPQAQIGNLLKEGDKLRVVMKTSETCVTVDTAVSNTLTIDTVSQIIPLVTIQADRNTVCQEDSIRFRVVSQVGQGNTPSYQWLSNNADISGAIDTVYTARFSPNTYNVAVRMTSSAGCIPLGKNPTTSNSVSVTFEPNQVTEVAIEDITNPEPPHICPKVQLDFRIQAQNAGANPSFIWRLNQNPTATSATTFSHHTWKGSDTVRLIVYPDFTCKVADSVVATRIINLSPNPLELGNNQTACLGTEVILKPTADLASQNPTYQWSTGATTPQITVSTAGTYHLTASFEGGCQYQDTVTVAYIPKPTVNLGNDTVYCKVIPDRILDAGNGTDYRYRWSTGDTTQRITANNPGIYWVRVNIGGNKDCEGIDSIRLEKNDGPKLTPIADFTICEDEHQTQEVSAGIADRYLWQPNGETTSTIFVDKVGTYSVTLADKQGCTNADTFTVSRLCKPTVIVPQVFTPNADGKNDYFQVYARNIGSFELWIFNRWGELVYYSTDANEKWWGKHRETDVPSGMYVYRLDYQGTEPNNPKETKMGEIQLIR